MKTLVFLLVAFAGFANAQNPAPPKAPWNPQGAGLDKPGTGTGPLGGGAYGKNTTVDILRAAYAKNEIAADQKFKGQQYAVSGVIEDIKADGTVTLKTPVRDLKVLGVRCEFADASTLAKLKSSRAVRLLGTIEGMKSGFLVIPNCSLSQ
jgi:hypothetical protein